MLSVQKAIWNALKGDTDLVALVSTYAGQPAIFTGDLVPEQAKLPFIVINPPFTAVKQRTSIYDGFELLFDIAVISQKTTSSALIDELTQAVYGVLLTTEIEIVDYKTLHQSVAQAISLDTDGEVAGRNIQFNIILLKQ